MEAVVKVEKKLIGGEDAFIMFFPDGSSYIAITKGMELFKLGEKGIAELFNELIKSGQFKIGEITGTYGEFDGFNQIYIDKRTGIGPQMILQLK